MTAVMVYVLVIVVYCVGVWLGAHQVTVDPETRERPTVYEES